MIPRMPRPVRTAGALALALGILALPSPAAAAGCDGVRGTDLAPPLSVKVVDRAPGTARHRYVACGVDASFAARPVPTVRRGEAITVHDVRGGILSYRGRRSGAVTVFDVRTGRARTIARNGKAPIGRVLVDATGAAAALFAGPRRTLVGYDADIVAGAYVLDRGSIPVASLKHVGKRVIGWTRDGTRGRADLRAPALPCIDVFGRELLFTPSIRVSELVYADEFLTGSLDGLTRLKRGCLQPGGPVRVLGTETVSTGGAQGGTGLTVLAAASGGSSVVTLEQSASSGEEVATALLSRVDLATGATVRLWGNADRGGPNTALGDLTPDPLVVVTPSGRVALIFERVTASPEREVVTFEPDGTVRSLDVAPAPDIDPASLRLDGTVLSWLHSGARRTVDLDAPA